MHWKLVLDTCTLVASTLRITHSPTFVTDGRSEQPAWFSCVLILGVTPARLTR
jgi:hypothetical protein